MRRSWIVVLVLVSSAVSGELILESKKIKSPSVHGSAPSGSTPNSPPGDKQRTESPGVDKDATETWNAVNEKNAKRTQRRLATPKAVNERLKSKTLFKDQDRASAVDIAKEQVPAIAVRPAWTGPQLAEDEKVAKYLSPFMARIVKTGEARESEKASLIVQSENGPIALPRGPTDALEPIDTDVRKKDGDQGWSPKLTAVPTSIPAKSSGLLTVGEGTVLDQLGVRFSKRDVEGAVVERSKIFYANADTDTDAVVEPTSTGASISWILRSPDAPEQQAFEVTPPAGASLEITHLGDLEIRKGSLVYARVSAPVAFDSQGSAVATQFEETKAGMRVATKHRGKDLAYPIAVDPIITWNGNPAVRAGNPDGGWLVNLTVWQPWTQWTNSIPGNLRTVGFQSFNSSGYSVLNLQTRAPTQPTIAIGEWRFDPIRNSTIVRADWANVRKMHTGINMQLGLVDGNTLNWQAGQWGANYSNGVLMNHAMSQFGNGIGWAMPANGTTITACSQGGPACTWGGPSNNKAYFQISTNASTPSNQDADTLGAYLYLSDNDLPTLAVHNQAAMSDGTWRQSSSLSPSVTATDGGLGLGSGTYGAHGSALEVLVDGTLSPSNRFGRQCDGGPASYCPDTFPTGTDPAPTVTGLVGERTVKLRTRDIIGRTATNSPEFTVRNDPAPPVIKLTGKLGAMATEAPQHWVEPRGIVKDTPIFVSVKDGSRANGSSRESGVKSVKAEVWASDAQGSSISHLSQFDPSTTSNAGVSDCNAVADPSKNSCPLTLSGTFPAESLAPGYYMLKVIAEDFSGRQESKYYKFVVGGSEITTLVEGQATSRYVPIGIDRKRLPNGSQAGVDDDYNWRLEWRASHHTQWNAVDATKVYREDDKAKLSSWPVTSSQAKSETLVVDLWDMRNSGQWFDVSKQVLFRAVVDGAEPPASRSSEDVAITFAPDGRGTSEELEEIGPGTVNLVTGDYGVSQTDFELNTTKSPLIVSRTYGSREGAPSATGVLGPGWTFSVPTEDAGSEFNQLVDYADPALPDEDRFGFVEIELADGRSVAFELDEASGKYTPEFGWESLRLIREADAQVPSQTNRFVLTDTDSSVETSFKRIVGDSEVGTYAPDSVREFGENGEHKMYWEFVAGVRRLTAIVAPTPAGSPYSCAVTYASLPRGCQGLRYQYAAVAVGSSTVQRLTHVYLKTYAPELSSGSTVTCNGSSMCEIQVARYAYDTGGRLWKSWDPRVTPNLITEYTYSQGLLASMKTGTDSAYSFTYETLPDDGWMVGRLKSVSRTLDSQVETERVKYFVPVSGDGAPFDFSKSTVSTWAQTKPPFLATAVFNPAKQPAGTTPTATEYGYATISYLDSLGQVLNTRAPGGRIDTTEYDKWGEVVRSLSPENRARALAVTQGSSQDAALKWDTKHVFEDACSLDAASVQRCSPSGKRRLRETLGPARSIRLENGSSIQARTRTQNTYDDGIFPDSETGEPFNLVTETRLSAMAGSTEHDVRRSTTSYGTSQADWRLGVERLTVMDPGSGNLGIKHKVDVDTEGRTTAKYQPRSQTLDKPSTTKTDYWTAGPHPTVTSCGGKPEWSGMPCRKIAGLDPAVEDEDLVALPGLPTEVYTYNHLRLPLTSAETVRKAGSDPSGVLQSSDFETRSSFKTYDLSGRMVTEGTTSTVGEPVKTIRHMYADGSGRETRTESLNSNGTVSKTILRAFDAFGRLVQYTDGEGHGSSTSYDVASRPVTASDGKTTRSYTYDELTGDLISLTDPLIGTFTATYDADGRVTQTVMPGGIQKLIRYSESGFPDYLSYQKTSGCSPPNCVLFENSAVESAHGQTRELYQNLKPQGQALKQTAYEYHYDKAGRLAKVDDWRLDGGFWKCTVRQYSLNEDSNRVGRTDRPENANYCLSSGGTSSTNDFDDADRLIEAGTSYDAFGRVTSMPQASAGGSGQFSATYYANDLARSISQNGTTQTFELDPFRRVSTKTEAGANSGTESYAYKDDTDSPAWVQDGTGAWQRDVTGITGVEGVQLSTGAARYYFKNLRGDIVAEGYPEPEPTLTTEIDEFGVPKTSLPDGRRYGFHGGSQREALTSAGITLMGARLYAPRLGQFLQTDPIEGGTENPYAYPSDPINDSDLTGQAAPLLVIVPVAVRVAPIVVGTAKVMFKASKNGKKFKEKPKAKKTTSKRKKKKGQRYATTYEVDLNNASGELQDHILEAVTNYFGVGTSGPGNPFMQFPPNKAVKKNGRSMSWHDSDRGRTIEIHYKNVKYKIRFNPWRYKD